MTLASRPAPFYPRGSSLVVIALAALGYSSPWLRGGTGTGALLWLALPGLLYRSAGLGIEKATVVVTITSGLLLLVGACLRILADMFSAGWPVQPFTDHDGAGERVRGRYLSFAGGYCFALGAAVLMPPSGAIVFLAALLIYLGMLAAFAGGRLCVPENMQKARHSTLRSFISECARESFFLGYAICFAVLASRYNAQLLLRSLLICFGVSLVLRAGLQGGSPSVSSEAGAD